MDQAFVICSFVLMNTKTMSIADLKAALDFSREVIADFKKKAKDNNITVEEIPAYSEWAEDENKLYHELFNRLTSIS